MRTKPVAVAWWVVGVLTAVRLWLVGQVGLGDDEAYYWTWAVDPDIGALEHPPLVGWLIALGTAVGGDTPLGVRWPFMACGLVLVAVMRAWAKICGGSAQAQAFVMLATAFVPALSVAHVFASPDMPALLAVALAARAFSLATRETEGGMNRHWVGVGLAVGAGLWAKLTVTLVPLSMLLVLLMHPPYRRWLARPGPWAGLAVATVCWVPWLVVESQRSWPMLRFQLVGRHHEVPGLRGLLTGLAGHLGYVSPVLAVATLVALLWVVRERRKRLFAVVGLAGPTIGVFLVAPYWTPALPHWGLAGWLAALPALAAYVEKRPVLARWSLGLAGAMTGLVYLQASTGLVPLGHNDPTHDLYGWRAVTPLLADVSARPDEAGCLPKLRASRYQVAGQAQFALGRSSDTFWPLRRPTGMAQLPAPRDPPERCGAPLVVSTSKYPFDGDECQQVGRTAVERGDAVVRHVYLHRCQ